MDPIQSTSPTSNTDNQLSNAFWSSILFAFALVASSVAAAATGNYDLLGVSVPVLLVVLAAIWFTNSGRQLLGGSLMVAAVGLIALLLPLLRSGLQPPLAIGSLALIGIFALTLLPRRYSGLILILGMLTITISVLVELFGPAGRAQASSPVVFWGVALLLLAVLVFLFSREFLGLSIRTKIVLGILSTGGLALAVFALVAASQTQKLTNILSGKLETSVSRLAEEQLVNRVDTLAEQANESFGDVREEVEGLAQNWVALQSQKPILRAGTYWDARTKLYQLKDGQFGNPASDTSSVYVPAKVTLTDTLYDEINTSAYLDFYAPAILSAHPSLLAVYAIDTNGITRYYPNIKLASVVPQGFDPTQRAYFQITSPLFNPQRKTRWSIPYVDATGGGLVVTVATPVYRGDEFNGIIAADMQLTQITDEVQSSNIGQTGYAFLIDDAGRILSMPPAGYKLFGLNPADTKPEEFFKQTILGLGTVELQSLVNRMVAGGHGLLVIQANGVANYVAFSPIQANGYSLALVVPVSELQGAIAAARTETQAQVTAGIRIMAVILIVLLGMAIVVSLAIGQILAAPVARLTGVANQIVAGDLGARAVVSSEDEIGSLSKAFNTMTSRLSESLQELETRVEERTAQLAKANERNERRARQFESISQLAATISSTRDLDALLPQITAAISAKFDFYHAGIFLLDARKEYAVLSAANSEGGQKMLANNHRLRVGETGIVGYVTSIGKPRVALSTGQDSVFFNNPLLPDTRSEIALPLKVGDEVIGALDVQSKQENAFGQEDINILTALADQVSIAIQNARQYDETRKALAESMAASRQFVQSGWQQFTQNEKIAGIRHSGAQATLLYTHNGNGQENRADSPRTKNRGVFLSLPVKLRGEVIGTVEVRSNDNRQWDQDELDIVTAIIERAAIALENARLLAESQKRAAKERTIGEISARISAQSDIDKLIQIAARELNRTLPGAEIAIQFHSNQEAE